MADGEARTKVLFVRVTPAQKAQLERRAKRTGLSGSVLVRDALHAYLSNDASTPAAEGADAAEETVSSR